MRLIADSGSSKTDWRLLNGEEIVQQFSSNGINPYYQKQDTIYNDIQNTLIPNINGNIEQVFFYGAGCIDDKKLPVEKALINCFPEAQIAVENDVLAAARALCNKEEGIACILGTGANSCFYNGRNITKNLRAFGFLLGDEGSGAYLGKQLIIRYLRKQLPEHLTEKFNNRFHLSEESIMEKVYGEPFPNRYLASFSKFLFHHQKDPYIYKLIYDAFEAFIKNYILKYQNAKAHKVHFVGSIAFYYANILRQACQDQGITVKNILETPIAGLTLYHQLSKD